MMMHARVWTLAGAFLLAGIGASTAQTAPPAGGTPPAPKPQTAAPPAPRAAAPASAGRVAATVMVTDQSGSSLADVHVTVTGPVEREGNTGRDGTLRLQGLKPGTYRLRFQSADFITFEREATVKGGAPAEIDAALNRAIAKPTPAPPVQPPQPPAGSGSAIAPDPGATAELVGLPDWIERNMIGRNDPLKETVVGKVPTSTATVIQVRDPLKDRSRSDADEMLYVIAGEGVLRSKGRDLALDAGSLVVLPRGVGYSIERRGRNPLIALSIVSK
jgi:hypothetical protein